MGGFYCCLIEPGIKMFALRSRQVVQQASLIQRQFGISAVVANKVADPIQKLFLDKLNSKPRAQVAKSSLQLNFRRNSRTNLLVLAESMVVVKELICPSSLNSPSQSLK